MINGRLPDLIIFKQFPKEQQPKLGANHMRSSVRCHYAGLSSRDLPAEAKYCQGTVTLPCSLWKTQRCIRTDIFMVFKEQA